MKEDEVAWRTLMAEIGGPTRVGDAESTSPPEPHVWRHDLTRLAPLTGLRRKDFGEDEEAYIKAVTSIVSPPRLPDAVPQLPDYFVKPQLVDDLISALLGTDISEIQEQRVVLTGVGGAGKSLIAAYVARAIGAAGETGISSAETYDLQCRFSDGVLWLDDGPGDFSEQNLLSQLNTLAKQFRQVVLSRRYRQGRTSQYDVAEFVDVGDATGYFLMWQKKFDLQCLLIVDNTWNVVSPRSFVNFKRSFNRKTC